MLLKTQTITGKLYHKGYTFSMSHFSYVAYKIPFLSWVFRAKLCVSESSLQITSTLHSSRKSFRELPDWDPPKQLSNTSDFSLCFSCAWSQMWIDTSKYSPLGLTSYVGRWIRTSMKGQFPFPWSDNHSLDLT